MNIKLSIPEKISTNKTYAGIHWAVRKKHADLFHKSMLQFKGKKIKESEYPVNINYIFTFKTKPLDSTNTTYMGKLLEDGLVKCGVLSSDDYKHVAFSGFYTQEGEEDLVEIIIA